MQSQHSRMPGRVRYGLTMAAVGALAACADPAAPADQATLVGQWHTAGAELIAIRAGAELRLPCATIIFKAPIGLTPAGSFATRGRYDGPGAHLGVLPSVLASGTLEGTRLRVAYPEAPGMQPVSRLLEAGAAAPSNDPPMCPL